ncbi:MAG: glycoside hydrolase family 95 protein, partial [Lachnoclostridium sp.]|nr:glycoside hydrolase family 95 protein [Lachnoclostridium sp.]
MSKLWDDKPAVEWEEAFPIGNGKIGAMIFGAPASEHLQLNEESIWYGGPVDRLNPDMKENLPKIRELIFDGKIAEAEKLMWLTMSGCPNSQHPYQTLGDMTIDF